MRSIGRSSVLALILVSLGTAMCSTPEPRGESEPEGDDCLCSEIGTEGEAVVLELDCYCEHYSCRTLDQVEGFERLDCENGVIAYADGHVFGGGTYWFRGDELVGFTTYSDAGSGCGAGNVLAGEQHCHPELCLSLDCGGDGGRGGEGGAR